MGVFRRPQKTERDQRTREDESPGMSLLAYTTALIAGMQPGVDEYLAVEIGKAASRDFGRLKVTEERTRRLIREVKKSIPAAPSGKIRVQCSDKAHIWPGSKWEVNEPSDGEPCECGKDRWYTPR